MRSLKMVFFCAIIFFAIPRDLAAQSLPNIFFKDVAHVAGGTGYILTSPLRWQGRDWMNFGAALGGTFALSFLDEEVNDYFQGHRSSTADKLSDIGITYGEPLTVVAFTGVVYVVGLSTRWERLRESAVILSGALLPTGGIQTVTKRITGRARPHLGLGHDVFEPFTGTEAYYSFFSGHVMVAMATSHVFAKQFPHPVTKVVFYSLGSLAGFARMYEEDHWLSDVVLGSAVAIVSVNSVSKWLAQQKQGKAVGAVQWRLFAQGKGLGVEMKW